jgi:hypothetical protein
MRLQKNYCSTTRCRAKAEGIRPAIGGKTESKSCRGTMAELVLSKEASLLAAKGYQNLYLVVGSDVTSYYTTLYNILNYVYSNQSRS